jgi:heme A synthase
VCRAHRGDVRRDRGGVPDVRSVALKLPWWQDWFATAHYAAAALLFTMFAVFSLVLFTRRDPAQPDAPDKTWRNAVYYGCGVAILAGIAWAAVAGMGGGSIFLPESIVLVAFATSWLVKGSIHKTIAERVRNVKA